MFVVCLPSPIGLLLSYELFKTFLDRLFHLGSCEVSVGLPFEGDEYLNTVIMLVRCTRREGW